MRNWLFRFYQMCAITFAALSLAAAVVLMAKGLSYFNGYQHDYFALWCAWSLFFAGLGHAIFTVCIFFGWVGEQ